MGRVRFGLRNLVYSIGTEADDGAITYGDVVKIPGAKEWKFSAEGDSTEEYADDGVYWSSDANNGYSGSMTMEDNAAVDAFISSVTGMTADSKGALIEKATDTQKIFALGGQMTLAGGKEVGKRIWFYRCKAARPELNATTKEKSPTVANPEVSITAMPRISDDVVKASCVSTDACYESFLDKVYEPTYSDSTTSTTHAGAGA